MSSVVVFALVSVKYYYFKNVCCCFLGLRFGLWFVYPNSLSKILVCDADDIVFILEYVYVHLFC